MPSTAGHDNFQNIVSQQIHIIIFDTTSSITDNLLPKKLLFISIYGIDFFKEISKSGAIIVRVSAIRI